MLYKNNKKQNKTNQNSEAQSRKTHIQENIFRELLHHPDGILRYILIVNMVVRCTLIIYHPWIDAKSQLFHRNLNFVAYGVQLL